MSKPHIHAESSARRFGGRMGDYLDIHEFIDSSKEAFSDVRHRALTHHPWFINNVLVRIFGRQRQNSDGQIYSVSDVAEHHVLEDFGGKYMPSAQDFLEQIEMQDWMDNGKSDTPPSSHRKLKKWQAERKTRTVSEVKASRPVRKRRGLMQIIKNFNPPDTEIYPERRPCGPPGAFD